MDVAEQQAWLAQWTRAARELDRLRTEELAALSEADALRAADALLSLNAAGELPAERLATSGLVEQQRLFLRLVR